MQNLFNDLTQLLQKDERFTTEGKLLKNTVIEAALQLDPALIKLLLPHESLKKNFFQNVDGLLVFDKIKFQKFVSNKSFLPDSYTAFSNKIGLTVGDSFISESKEVILSWPHKDCVLEGGQTKEDEKRDEIFWNKTLAPDEIDRLLSPKVFNNFKKYDSKGEHKVTDITLKDNLIIKGNNLLALYSLLPVYRGRIKLICIDPPYNTGNDTFLYNDSFNHSTWLTFIKNRLEIAREFLTQDGSIFISIDDKEQAYLKILCDEIFGRDNYVGLISVAKGTTTGQDAKLLGSSVDYLLIYAKKISNFELLGLPLSSSDLERFSQKDEKGNYSLLQLRKTGNGDRKEDRPNLYYPVIAPDGSRIFPIGPTGYLSRWRVDKNTYSKWVDESFIEWIERNGKYVPYVKYYAEGRTKQVSNLWNDIEGNKKATIQLKEIFGERIFNNPKPVGLIKKIIFVTGVGSNDIVLDFFSGSGTTAQSVIEFNKENDLDINFILCEQLKYVDEITKKRAEKVLYKIGSGSFIYIELAKLNQNFVDKITKANNTKELTQIWETIKKDGFISYKVEPKEIDKNVAEFEQLSLQDQKKFLIEVLDKNHLYVNYSEIDDKDYKISEEDKKLNKKFYSLK